MGGYQAWGGSKVYSRSCLQRAELLVGTAGSLFSSKPAQPGLNIKIFVISPCFPSASTRHRHGVGVRRPKEAFLVALVQKDHCVSKTHATPGKRAHFCGAALKTLSLTS